MGGSSSRPAPPPPKPPVVIPPPITRESMCMVNKVQLNQLKGDVSRKQTDVDNCDPQEALRRKLEAMLKENNDFVNSKKQTLRNELNVFDEVLNLARNISESKKPLREFLTELKHQQSTLTTEESLLKQDQRAGRRRFLDNSPQEKVASVLGIHTTDDKIMLAFWVCYLFSIVVLTFILTSVYGESWGIQTTKQKISLDLVIIGICYGIAYYAIVKYA